MSNPTITLDTRVPNSTGGWTLAEAVESLKSAKMTQLIPNDVEEISERVSEFHRALRDGESPSMGAMWGAYYEAMTAKLDAELLDSANDMTNRQYGARKAALTRLVCQPASITAAGKRARARQADDLLAPVTIAPEAAAELDVSVKLEPVTEPAGKRMQAEDILARIDAELEPSTTAPSTAATTPEPAPTPEVEPVPAVASSTLTAAPVATPELAPTSTATGTVTVVAEPATRGLSSVGAVVDAGISRIERPGRTSPKGTIMTSTAPEAPVIDVNQEFFNRRRNMIASGAMTRRDDGTWVAADKAEVLGKEGLDMTTGQAALFSSVTPWHGLGNVIPGGLKDINEVLRLGGIDWTTEVVETMYDWKGEPRVHEGRYTMVRSDTGAALGQVGGRYEPWQNRDQFTFLLNLVEQGEALWESAGALRDGKHVFVCMRLPENIRIDADGINDEIVPFLVAINSHDGRSQAKVMVTPWRIVCANTERLAVADAYTEWKMRHVKGAMDRVAEARDSLKFAMQYYTNFGKEMTQLVQTDMELDAFDKFLAEMFPINDEARDSDKRKAEARRDTLIDLYTVEAGQVGRNAYAAERAVTGYYDWLTPLKPSAARPTPENIVRGTRAMEGDNDGKKNAAHSKLMLLVRR